MGTLSNGICLLIFYYSFYFKKNFIF